MNIDLSIDCFSPRPLQRHFSKESDIWDSEAERSLKKSKFSKGKKSFGDFNETKRIPKLKIENYFFKRQIAAFKENFVHISKIDSPFSIEKSNITYFTSFCCALEKNSSLKVK